jgi:tetratricopeptide (TPR) repeat protein
MRLSTNTFFISKNKSNIFGFIDMKKIFFILFIFLTKISISQNIDSLIRILNDTTSDTTKVRLYLEISEAAYPKEDFETLYKYAKLAFDLTEKKLEENPSPSFQKIYLRNKADALHQLGLSSYLRGNVIESFDYYKRAIEIYEKINRTYDCSVSFINLGAIYENVGDIPHAIEYYNNAIKLLDKITNRGDKEKNMLGVALNNLAKLYSDNNSFTKAEESYLKSLTQFEELNDSMSIGEAQYGLGEVYYNKGNMIKATESYIKAEKIANKTTNKEIAVFSKNRLARIYQNKGNFSKAEEYYKQILKLLKPDDKRLLAMILRNYAGLYLLKNKLRKAEEIAIRALILAKETKNIKSIRDEAEMLCKIYNSENNIKKSPEVCALYAAMNDSVKNEEAKKAEGFVKFKEEYEKHEAQLSDGKKNEAVQLPSNNKKKIIVGSIIAALLFIAILFLLRKLKN